MIYMDNAATTKISKPVADEILNTVEVFGNPSSLHRLGLEAEKKVESAREMIAKKLGVPPFAVRKYREQAERFTKEKLKRALDTCLDTEQDIKTGKLSEQVGLELLLVSLGGE